MIKIILGFILLFPFLVSADAENTGITIEEFLENLSTVKGVTKRRDPFEAAKPPFVTTNPNTDVVENAPPHLKYQVEAYTLVATLTGDKRYPRVLIRLPASEGGGLQTMQLTERLGNRGGKIIEINEGNIVVLQNQRTPLGFIDKTRITLFVGGKKPAGAK